MKINAVRRWCQMRIVIRCAQGEYGYSDPFLMGMNDRHTIAIFEWPNGVQVRMQLGVDFFVVT